MQVSLDIPPIIPTHITPVNSSGSQLLVLVNDSSTFKSYLLGPLLYTDYLPTGGAPKSLATSLSLRTRDILSDSHAMTKIWASIQGQFVE